MDKRREVTGHELMCLCGGCMQVELNKMEEDRDAAIQRAEAAERETDRLREQVKLAHDALMVAAGYIAFRVEMVGHHPETNQSYRIVAKAIAAIDGSGGQREE